MQLAKITTPAASKSRSGSAAPFVDVARPPAALPPSGDVVLLVLADMAPGARLWGWSRLVRGRRMLGDVAGLRFAKVLGSGQGGGFGLRPSWSHQSVFMAFDGEDSARRFVSDGTWLPHYRAHARELCLALLAPTRSRGRWGGHTLTPSVRDAASSNHAGPVAALTRASIRPSKAVAFWRHAPRAQASLATFPGCRLAAGLGEAPLLRQATFSLWDSADAMEAYARTAAHGEAARAAYAEGYFSESMFTRFRVLCIQGCWQGVMHG